MRPEMVEQFVGSLPVMYLSSGQAEPDREALRIDNRTDLGREATPGSDRDNDLNPPFPSQPVGTPGWECSRSSGYRHHMSR